MTHRIRRRSVLGCAALAALLTAPVALAAPAFAAPTTTPPVIDFNGDGFADLAISAPNATVSGVGEAGYLSVVYGSSAGADSAHPKLITRATEGVPGTSRSTTTSAAGRRPATSTRTATPTWSSAATARPWCSGAPRRAWAAAPRSPGRRTR
ncbi:hypothetical protein SAV31267_055790 [Streptomyces avermitilis]|uniref:Secreted protein n=1 Tax=Streptomyces avermitilis TaxID=33903 RepID=A0A4D4MWG8_STRAX|nr:hypothetical protein SAV31267_055790 [Streptomyces avermitilis]